MQPPTVDEPECEMGRQRYRAINWLMHFHYIDYPSSSQNVGMPWMLRGLFQSSMIGTGDTFADVDFALSVEGGEGK